MRGVTMLMPLLILGLSLGIPTGPTNNTTGKHQLQPNNDSLSISTTIVPIYTNDTADQEANGTNQSVSTQQATQSVNSPYWTHAEFLRQHAAQIPEHHFVNTSVVESHSITDWYVHQNESMNEMAFRNVTKTMATHSEHQAATADRSVHSKVHHREAESKYEHTIKLQNGKKNASSESEDDGFKATGEVELNNATIDRELVTERIRNEEFIMGPEVEENEENEKLANVTTGFVQGNTTNRAEEEEETHQPAVLSVEPTSEVELILSNNTAYKDEYKESTVEKSESNTTTEEHDLSYDNETISWETGPAPSTTTMATTTTMMPATTTILLTRRRAAPLLGDESSAIEAKIALDNYRMGDGSIGTAIIEFFRVSNYAKETASGAVNFKFTCSRSNGYPFFVVTATVADKMPHQVDYQDEGRLYRTPDLDHVYPSPTRVLVIQRGPRRQKMVKVEVWFQGCVDRLNYKTNARKVTFLRTYDHLDMDLVPEEIIDLAKVNSEAVKLKDWQMKKAEALNKKLYKK